jgi:hypothetical protein
MTCAENRVLHSALLDGELGGDERALVEGHLAGCPECAQELERLARMLGMLQALPAARAPLGFVDRVLEAARPTPWYARLGRRILQPWRVKVPLQAAALVVVALGAVYVYQRAPELQQAARYEATPPSPTSPPPSAPPPAAREPAPPAPARAPEPPAGSKAVEHQETAARADSPEPAKRESDTGARDASRSNVMKDTAPPATPAPAAPAEAERAREKKADAPEPAPRTQAEDRSSRLGEAAPSAPLQSRMLVAPDASGRLAVDDREAAERALAELRARLGVAESFRRDAGEGGVLIEMVVPRQGYADFTRGLAAIGRWTADRDPAAPPEQIRLQILLVR